MVALRDGPVEGIPTGCGAQGDEISRVAEPPTAGSATVIANEQGPQGDVLRAGENVPRPVPQGGEQQAASPLSGSVNDSLLLRTIAAILNLITTIFEFFKSSFNSTLKTIKTVLIDVKAFLLTSNLIWRTRVEERRLARERALEEGVPRV